MSRLHVLTESGSEYVIDPVAETWTRIAGKSAGLRTETGTYWSYLIFDAGLLIIGPPVNPALDMRRIQTSPVTEYWEEEREVKDQEGQAPGNPAGEPGQAPGRVRSVPRRVPDSS